MRRPVSYEPVTPMATDTKHAAPCTRHGSGRGPSSRLRALLADAAWAAVRFTAVRVLGPGGDAVALSVLRRVTVRGVAGRDGFGESYGRRASRQG